MLVYENLCFNSYRPVFSYLLLIISQLSISVFPIFGLSKCYLPMLSFFVYNLPDPGAKYNSYIPQNANSIRRTERFCIDDDAGVVAAA